MIFPQLLLTSIFFFLSAIHIYWAFGGKWGQSSAVPTDSEGNSIFKPSLIATLTVAIGLAFFGTFYLNSANVFSIGWPQIINNIGGWGIPTIFLLRAIGDFKYVGAFKRIKNTEFAIKDSKFFSPLCFMIGIIGFYILINQ